MCDVPIHARPASAAATCFAAVEQPQAAIKTAVLDLCTRAQRPCSLCQTLARQGNDAAGGACQASEGSSFLHSATLEQPADGKQHGMVMTLQLFQDPHRRQEDTPLRLAAGYEDGSVLIWDLGSQAELASLRLFSEPVMALAIAPSSTGEMPTSASYPMQAWPGQHAVSAFASSMRSDCAPLLWQQFCPAACIHGEPGLPTVNTLPDLSALHLVSTPPGLLSLLSSPTALSPSDRWVCRATGKHCHHSSGHRACHGRGDCSEAGKAPHPQPARMRSDSCQGRWPHRSCCKLGRPGADLPCPERISACSASGE